MTRYLPSIKKTVHSLNLTRLARQKVGRYSGKKNKKKRRKGKEEKGKRRKKRRKLHKDQVSARKYDAMTALRLILSMMLQLYDGIKERGDRWQLEKNRLH